MGSNRLAIDHLGRARCWNCGGNQFVEKGLLRTKPLDLQSVHTTKRTVSCASCKKQNNNKSTQNYKAPASKRAARKSGANELDSSAPLAPVHLPHSNASTSNQEKQTFSSDGQLGALLGAASRPLKAAQNRGTRKQVWIWGAVGFTAIAAIGSLGSDPLPPQPQELALTATETNDVQAETETPVETTKPRSNQTSVTVEPDDDQEESQPTPAYEVIVAEELPGIKLSLDVILADKPTTEALEVIAREIYDHRRGDQYDLVFIVHYLPGMVIDSGGWATTHYRDGTLSVNVRGISEEEELSVRSQPSALANDDVIGTWHSPGFPWVARIVVAKTADGVKVEETYDDGTSNLYVAKISSEGDGTRIDVEDAGYSAETDEHLLITTDGYLEWRDFEETFHRSVTPSETT